MITKRIPNPLQEMAAKFLSTHEAWALPSLLAGKQHSLVIPGHKPQPVSWFADSLPALVEEYSLELVFQHGYISVGISDTHTDKGYHIIAHKKAPTCCDQFGNIYVGHYEATEHLRPCFCLPTEEQETTTTSTST
jgi:hypothetical protein